MSAQNCFQRTKTTSFSFLFEASPYHDFDYTITQSFSGSVNNQITNRELACNNLLTAAVTRSQTTRDPILLLNSTIPKRTLPPPYPYPRTGFGNGYSYPEYVEFGADETTVVVRYLTNPTSEELAWPTTLPVLVVSTGHATPLPQVKTIVPSAYTTGTIYARLEVINDAKKITNFIPTNYGSGAILYPNAPNDPAPSDTSIPRLFASKTQFDNTVNISQNGKNNRPCSGCDLCRLDADTAFIPEELWNYSITMEGEIISGSGFPFFDFGTVIWQANAYDESASPLNLVVAGLNTNPKSPACKQVNNNIYQILLFIGPPNYYEYFRQAPLQIGRNTFECINYDSPPATVTIGLTYD
jgi:hypothetical protein